MEGVGNGDRMGRSRLRRAAGRQWEALVQWPKASVCEMVTVWDVVAYGLPLNDG